MPLRFRFDLLIFARFLGILLLASVAAAQAPSTALLKLQRSKAHMDLQTNIPHARGMDGLSYGQWGNMSSYPNSLACLVVYGDGKFVFEKRDEVTIGKPKVKLAEGTLAADDLQHLKEILADEGLKKIATPPPPTLPDNTAAIREIETVDAQIDRAGTLQRFTTIKERVKTGPSSSGGITNGMDSIFDNGSSFQKTLNPLMKWFEGLEKKSKSDFKDSSSQYCEPMNIGAS